MRKNRAQVAGAGWLSVKDVPTTWSHSQRAAKEEQKSIDLDIESDRGDAAKIQFRRDWRALAESWDQKLQDARADKRNLDHVSRLPPMRRTASLPHMLDTRFGGNYEKNITNPFEENAKRSRNLKPQAFLMRGSGPDVVMDGISKKPLLEDYTMRTLQKKVNSPILSPRRNASTSVL